MSTADGLTIGRVSALLGVPVPTLRSWHRRYGVAPPQRTSGGHRRYAASDVQVLRALNAAVSRGIAPSTAAQALRGPRPDPDVPVELLTRMLDAVSAGDQAGLAAVLDDAEQALGVEAAVDRLLIPGLREVGLRWEHGAIDVGLEHLATTAVRRWIARRTGLSRVRPEPAPVLLAGAPGNAHTVGLEAFGMLLDRRGWPTRQLGADTPVASLLSALRRTGAQAAVVTAHQVSRRRAAVEALRLLSAQPVVLFYAGGAFDSERRRRDVPGTYLGTSLPAAVDLVERELR